MLNRDPAANFIAQAAQTEAEAEDELLEVQPVFPNHSHTPRLQSSYHLRPMRANQMIWRFVSHAGLLLSAFRRRFDQRWKSLNENMMRSNSKVFSTWKMLTFYWLRKQEAEELRHALTASVKDKPDVPLARSKGSLPSGVRPPTSMPPIAMSSTRETASSDPQMWYILLKDSFTSTQEWPCLAKAKSLTETTRAIKRDQAKGAWEVLTNI